VSALDWNAVSMFKIKQCIMIIKCQQPILVRWPGLAASNSTRYKTTVPSHGNSCRTAGLRPSVMKTISTWRKQSYCFFTFKTFWRIGRNLIKRNEIVRNAIWRNGEWKLDDGENSPFRNVAEKLLMILRSSIKSDRFFFISSKDHKFNV